LGNRHRQGKVLPLHAVVDKKTVLDASTDEEAILATALLQLGGYIEDPMWKGGSTDSTAVQSGMLPHCPKCSHYNTMVSSSPEIKVLGNEGIEFTAVCRDCGTRISVLMRSWPDVKEVKEEGKEKEKGLTIEAKR